MTSLGDWAYRTLTGRTEPAPLGGFLEQLAELRAKTGSVAGTARAAGLPRRTVRYWFERLAMGKTPKPKAETMDKLSAAVRESRLSPARPSDAQVELHTRDRDRGTARTISGRQLKLAPGTMERMAREWVRTGDPEAAGAVFLEGVRDQWYRNYLKPRDRDERTTRTVHTPAPQDGDEEDDDYQYGEEDDDYQHGEDWPYDDLAYEDYYGEADEGYGGDVE